jgi:hypothetical protein
MGDEPRELWECSHCGVSERNRAAWCDLGCGSDYNQMTRVVVTRAPLSRGLQTT